MLLFYLFLSGIVKSIKPGDLESYLCFRAWLDDPFVKHIVSRCRRFFVKIMFDFLKLHPLNPDENLDHCCFFTNSY